jgi:hypothetical protein
MTLLRLILLVAIALTFVVNIAMLLRVLWASVWECVDYFFAGHNVSLGIKK